MTASPCRTKGEGFHPIASGKPFIEKLWAEEYHDQIYIVEK